MKEPKPVRIDADGTKWWRWMFEYDWHGATYGFDIVATSERDARDRLARLPLARFVGQADGEPVKFSRGGFLLPFVVWWRNATRRS